MHAMFFPSILLFFALLTLPLGAQDAPVMRSAWHDYRVVTVADGLENPWDMAFLDDGTMFLTDRGGSFKHTQLGDKVRKYIADAGIEKKDIGAAWLGTCFENINVGKSALPLSMTLRLPARVCSSSTFCVIKVNSLKNRAISAIAVCPGLGATSPISLRRQLYHSQTNEGSRRKASGVANSSGRYFFHRPC